MKNLPTNKYQTLLNEKTTHLSQLLQPFTDKKVLDNISVYLSPTLNFRMRAEFGIWHEGDDCYYTMVEKGENGQSQRIKVTDFPIASHAINELMPKLLAEIKQSDILKQKLFQVEFLSTLSGDMLVTLIYHKKLAEDWLELSKPLESRLNCHIIGRSRKQKLVLTQDFVLEKLTVLDKNYFYQQVEGGFTQPNAKVCESMLTWACQQADYIQQQKQQSAKSDLLELYCGNANFTLPLSQYFKQVLATEISKTSVKSAQFNIEKNNIDNIAIARLSAEEFTQAKQGEREFRRLQQADISLNNYQFSTVFVDPPRAGIDNDTLQLLSEFEFIIYVSCNPQTLADNLQTLSNTHQVVNVALFDQFPYTHHIESGVLLQKVK
ncbi:MAG: tRNA (uridine(54)-C5)-methyltransferase TrmA [Moraxellaceae bacterium]|nr:tRNA (uridine(54)-C5)-methyltransferase TrmA [Moraxellaceae bacterium]